MSDEATAQVKKTKHLICVDSRVLLSRGEANHKETRIYTNQINTLDHGVVASSLIAPPL